MPAGIAGAWLPTTPFAYRHIGRKALRAHDLRGHVMVPATGLHCFTQGVEHHAVIGIRYTGLEWNRFGIVSLHTPVIVARKR